MCDQKECKKATKPSAPIPPSPLSCSSVIGVVFDKGVILAADTLVSYEGLALFTNARRIIKVNDTLLLGGGNNYADFQYLQSVVEDKSQTDLHMDPLTLQSFLRTGIYNRCIKDKTLRVDLLLGGMQHDLPYLSRINHRGYVIQEKVSATGPVANMVLPFLNNEVEKRQAKRGICEEVSMGVGSFEKSVEEGGEGVKDGIDEQSAREMVWQCMMILYRRHTLSHPVYTMGVVDEGGARLEMVNLLEV